MFTLIDGIAQRLAHPDTFHIPNTTEVVALKPGQYVKLGFQEGGNTERAWVEIKSIDGRRLTGVVNNDIVLMKTVKDGDEVSFEFQNIIGIFPHSARGSTTRGGASGGLGLGPVDFPPRFCH